MMKLLCSAAVLGTNFTSEISWTVKTENVTYIDSLSFFLSNTDAEGRVQGISVPSI